MSSSDGGRRKRRPKSLKIPANSTFGRATAWDPSAAARDFALFDNCDEAVSAWDPDWSMCPVCGATPDADGFFTHNDEKN